jgi:D-proline reductase (dithiol) PrdB
MVRLADIPEPKRSRLRDLECPHFDSMPWVDPPDLDKATIAIVSTAGLHLSLDRPFQVGSADYRVIPSDCGSGDLVMTHVSPNFDRAGYGSDWNVCFPLDRLRKLEADRVIGATAKSHYSFMKATDPRAMEPHARQAAHAIIAEGVDAVILVPA